MTCSERNGFCSQCDVALSPCSMIKDLKDYNRDESLSPAMLLNLLFREMAAADGCTVVKCQIRFRVSYERVESLLSHSRFPAG